ncbi:transcriptional regulator, AraC family protein [Microscilla marina ATCC 23134]|uniref:Transcriptional regulator, AraC family protein n=2 Tax=Microscilla marina TaxID=1027 RepID=A1ZHS6_MICM2|nr:transcriptional regulator, AraC family protein [Microscilla marina ATCC 23134]
MILEHETLDLFGKSVFERATLRAPFKKKLTLYKKACFLYITRGACHAFAPDVVVKAEEKEAVLMKCGHYTGRFLGESPHTEYQAIAVHFYPEVLNKVYEYTLPDCLTTPPHLNKQSMAKLPSGTGIERYMGSIAACFENFDEANQELMALKLKELVTVLSATQHAPEVRAVLSNLFVPTSFTFQELVAANLYTNITLQELAQLASLSESSLKRMFKKVYQDSPASYLRHQKLLRSQELLTASNLSITQITLDCGFNDVAHFSKLFKQKYGVSPSAYRVNQLV